MAQPEKAAPALDQSPSASSPEARTNRILIVDDEVTSRDLCREFLESDGFNVETCDRVRKALALLAVKKFDLVLTDLTMPELDGIHLVREVRYHYPHTSVIMSLKVR